MDIDPYLSKAVHDCTLCPLSGSRSGVAVPSLPGSLYEPGGIALMADVVASAADSSAGRPFVGNRGEVSTLKRMLEAVDLSFDHVLLMFRVRCQPAHGKLDDHPEALYNCDTWTKAELARYCPSVVVLMGKTVTQEVFGKESLVTTTRGKPRTAAAGFEMPNRVWVPTLHPYAASRTKQQEIQVTKDLRLAVALARGAI